MGFSYDTFCMCKFFDGQLNVHSLQYPKEMMAFNLRRMELLLSPKIITHLELKDISCPQIE